MLTLLGTTLNYMTLSDVINTIIITSTTDITSTTNIIMTSIVPTSSSTSVGKFKYMR